MRTFWRGRFPQSMIDVYAAPLVLIFPMKVVLCKSFTIYRFLKLAYPSLSSLLMFNCLPREFWKLQWELILTFIRGSKLWLFCNWSKIFHRWHYLILGSNKIQKMQGSRIFRKNWKSRIWELENVVGLAVNMVDWTLWWLAHWHRPESSILYSFYWRRQHPRLLLKWKSLQK